MSVRTKVNCWVQPAVTEQTLSVWFGVGKFWWRKGMRKDLRIHNTYLHYVYTLRGFLGGAVVKNSPARAGDARGGFSPWVRKIPWRRKRHPLRYSCLGNPMGRGAWGAAGRGVTQSQTRLSPHAHTNTCICIIHMYVCMHTYCFC